MPRHATVRRKTNTNDNWIRASDFLHGDVTIEGKIARGCACICVRPFPLANGARERLFYPLGKEEEDANSPRATSDSGVRNDVLFIVIRRLKISSGI